MLAAHAAGMPGNDAAQAAANLLQRLVMGAHEACEAREHVVGASYVYDPVHAIAMLEVLEAACKLAAAARVRGREGA